MKVIEKQWKYGTYLAYEDIEEIFIPITPGVRVLPAPFFYDKKLYFEFHKRYEPGEHKSFPTGGYEVRDMSGGVHSFDLDQVIVHPIVLKHKKMLDKMARRAEKQAKIDERRSKKVAKNIKPTNSTGKRGRPALSPEVKAQREVEKVNTAIKSGGKRGRPKKEDTEPKPPKQQSSGRRGRPALSAEVKAQRVLNKIATKERTGGKRGRPRSK
jgi:hypothetical protein